MVHSSPVHIVGFCGGGRRLEKWDMIGIWKHASATRPRCYKICAACSYKVFTERSAEEEIFLSDYMIMLFRLELAS